MKEELGQIKRRDANAERIMDRLEQLERKLNCIIVAMKVGVSGEILVVD